MRAQVRKGGTPCDCLCVTALRRCGDNGRDACSRCAGRVASAGATIQAVARACTRSPWRSVESIARRPVWARSFPQVGAIGGPAPCGRAVRGPSPSLPPTHHATARPPADPLTHLSSTINCGGCHRGAEAAPPARRAYPSSSTLAVAGADRNPRFKAPRARACRRRSHPFTAPAPSSSNLVNDPCILRDFNCLGAVTIVLSPARAGPTGTKTRQIQEI